MNFSAPQLFVLCCSVMSYLGRFSLINNTHLGMTVVRFLYSRACAALIRYPERVEVVEDVHIPANTGKIGLRIYRPCRSEVLPALVYLHGGCFSVGDLNSHDCLLRAIANAAKTAVISVDYRRSPEHKYPCAAEDAYTALQWVYNNAENFAIDPCLISLGGDSAGAALAAVLARWLRDRGGPSLRSQVLLCPTLDSRMKDWEPQAKGSGINREVLAVAWIRYAPDQSVRCSADVSALASTDLAFLPPALIISAENDPLRNDGKAYAEALQAAGVAAQFSLYPNAAHAFMQFPDCANGQKAVREIAGFLAQMNAVTVLVS